MVVNPESLPLMERSGLCTQRNGRGKKELSTRKFRISNGSVNDDLGYWESG